MVYHILQKIRAHKELVARHKSQEISDEEMEKHLLQELSYFQESTIEEKLNQDIVEQEEKLLSNLIKISDIVTKHKISRQSFENLIYSELNSMFYKHL